MWQNYFSVDQIHNTQNIHIHNKTCTSSQKPSQGKSPMNIVKPAFSKQASKWTIYIAPTPGVNRGTWCHKSNENWHYHVQGIDTANKFIGIAQKSPHFSNSTQRRDVISLTLYDALQVTVCNHSCEITATAKNTWRGNANLMSNRH